jgi:predicted esterase
MRARLYVASLVGAVAAAPLSARASPRPDHREGPCDQCLSSLPAGDDPRPLLVLLHGDGENAASMFQAWEPAAAARGNAVLALACNRAQGCTSKSWWRWNGSPSWIERQAAALGELRPIDVQRMWIVGWSGGGTYLGMRTQELESTFAALVIHGGGIAPASAACSTVRAPVYFLVGNANPLHYLAEGLRDYYTSCGNDVTWTLLRGADHDGERRALTAHREAILDWLESKRLTLPVAAAGGTDELDAPSAPPRPEAPAGASPMPPTAPPASCRCMSAGGARDRPERDQGMLASIAAVAAAVRRAQRPHRPAQER